jgi:hypothetical protein
VYIDTGSSMPISPSKSGDLVDENNKILTEWKWFETTVFHVCVHISFHQILSKPRFWLENVNPLTELSHVTFYTMTDCYKSHIMMAQILLPILRVWDTRLLILFFLFYTYNNVKVAKDRFVWSADSWFSIIFSYSVIQ